jgi:transposase
MCEILVGLGDVNVLSVTDEDAGVTVTVETRTTVVGCPSCGSVATSKGRRAVSLFDCCHGLRRFVVVWLKRRWRCLAPECPTRSWTEEDRTIAAPRLALTDRAGRWVTEQVGRFGRSVNEVATAIGCDWHTVNDAVVAYGTALVDDPDRFGEVRALGLDEVLFARLGTYRTATFSTQLVDVEAGQLLDVVEGKKADEPKAWLEQRGEEWLGKVRFATLDLSATYKSVFDATVPDAIQVADPFHVVKHATFQLDQCRRRVQQELTGHRGRKGDPLFRRLLAKAHERLDDRGNEKLTGLLEAGDPKGQVRMTWHADRSPSVSSTPTPMETSLSPSSTS